MNTIRLTVTTDLKREIDFLRMMEYPTLTDAEIVKVAVGAQAVESRRKNEEPFWGETKLKPLKLKKSSK